MAHILNQIFQFEMKLEPSTVNHNVSNYTVCMTELAAVGKLTSCYEFVLVARKISHGSLILFKI